MVRIPNDLECGPAIAGTSGTTSLFQSGEDAGWINEIDYSTKKLVRQFATLVDEPYGMDSDAAGNLYVANKDDDNILKVSPAGTTTVFVTGSLDDPRGVEIGPKYTTPPSSDGDVATVDRYDNDGPEILLLNGTHQIHGHEDIRMHKNTAATFGVAATDSEGEQITLDLIPYAIPKNVISLIDGGKNGTAIVSLDASSMVVGTYAFMITASDPHNLERQIYTVVVAEP